MSQDNKEAAEIVVRKGDILKYYWHHTGTNSVTELYLAISAEESIDSLGQKSRNVLKVNDEFGSLEVFTSGSEQYETELNNFKTELADWKQQVLGEIGFAEDILSSL